MADTTIVISPPLASTNTTPKPFIYTATIDAPVARTFSGSITSILNEIAAVLKQDLH